MLSLEDSDDLQSGACLDDKIKQKIKELESLEDNKQASADPVAVFKVPKPRVKRAGHLNSSSSSNRIIDNIRYHLDGLKSASPSLREESLDELLISSKKHPDLVRPFLHGICTASCCEKALLIVVLCAMDVLKIESFLPTDLGVKLIDFAKDERLDELGSSLVKEFFEEFETLCYWDLMVWLLSRYCMSCEVQGLPLDSSIASALTEMLSVFDKLSEMTMEVASALFQFWLVRNHQEAIDALCYASIDSRCAPFKRMLIAATGFMYGAEKLFETCITDLNPDDDLDVTVAINFVDRLPQHRRHFLDKRSDYAAALQSNPTNEKLALLVGFLYEADASKELEPSVHAIVKASCRSFRLKHAEHLDEDSKHALDILLQSL